MLCGRSNDAQSKKGGCDISMKKYATVTQVSPLRIKFDGETVASDNLYNRLASYSPKLNDRVVVDVDNEKYLILGEVVK